MANIVTPFGFRPIRRLNGEACGNLTQRKIANNGGGALNPWRVTPPPVKRPVRGPDAVICCTRLSPLERVAMRGAGLLCFARSAIRN
jgi:hypothetical protein